MAPKMIHSRPRVTTSPCSVEAITRLKLMSQPYSAISALTKYTSGMARRAGQRSPTSKMLASKMGVKASKARNPDDMGSSCRGF